MGLKNEQAGGLFDAPATAIASSDRIKGLLEQMQTVDVDENAELARATREMDPAVFRALRDRAGAKQEIVPDDDLAVPVLSYVPHVPAPATVPAPEVVAVTRPMAPAHVQPRWVKRAIIATCIAVYVVLLVMSFV